MMHSSRALGSGNCITYPLPHRTQPIPDGFLVLGGLLNSFSLVSPAITADATLYTTIDELGAHGPNVLLVTA
jgi:hypothetical protein